ncbi:MAG TPA: polysaccharide deacetylase family protein [Solirubrobacteraceae bacterium]|jgi:peptidoglycan/xylan/chitin deacetylase (PgdA/CDA1 family)|nr:polysaccharide deacetylase family protein [Solirubrobacteraceae bacterium]
MGTTTQQPRHVTNLNFHGIGRPLGRDFGEGERDFWVKPEIFEATLDAAALRDNVVLSFDDGNTTDVDIALAALQERGLQATFFIVPSWLGNPGFMTKADVRTLVASGMTVGNHGLQHHRWTELGRPELEHEVSAGRQMLEELTGAEIETVAIPYGAYNDLVLDTLRDYRHVFTSDGGSADPEAWLQSREHVRADQTAAEVQQLLDSAL